MLPTSLSRNVRDVCVCWENFARRFDACPFGSVALSSDVVLELLPALFYLLEWHYQHLIFDESGPFIIRQHCGALLVLIGSGLGPCPPEAAVDIVAADHREKLFACFCKWFSMAARHGVNEFSQKLLLAACLMVGTRARLAAENSYRNFVDRYLVPFVSSTKYDDLTRQLSNSPLVRPNATDRNNQIPQLPNVGAVVTKDNQAAPTLLVDRSYPVFLLRALLCLILADQEPCGDSLEQLFTVNTYHFNYLATLMKVLSGDGEYSDAPRRSCNWFLKTELRYILDVVALLLLRKRKRFWLPAPNSSEVDVDMEQAGTRRQLTATDSDNDSIILHVAYGLTCHLSEEFYPDLMRLFDEVIFVRQFYDSGTVATISEADLQRWKFQHKQQLVISNEGNRQSDRNCCAVIGWKTSLLSRSWPYAMLYQLVEKLEGGPVRVPHRQQEVTIVDTSLRFSELLEANGIVVATDTERLMYLMAAFLGPDAKFLDPALSALLGRRIDGLRADTAGKQFAFEATKIEGRKSFDGLYQLVLDAFQGSSYGHTGFSSLVMAPLAQRYNARWRNLVWSEHVAVLRFITCGEQELLGSMDDYLQPEETEVVLLRSYGQALNSNLLRTGSLPHRVASHHMQRYRLRISKCSIVTEQMNQDGE